MSEPLTSSLLMELVAKLHVAFPRTIGEKNPAMMADVYRNGLRGVSGDAVRVAVDRVIQDDTYFPKVSRLREIAWAWDKARISETRRAPAWDECPICGARARWVDVTEASYDAQGKPAVDAEGSPLLAVIGQRSVMEHRRGPHGIAEQREQLA